MLLLAVHVRCLSMVGGAVEVTVGVQAGELGAGNDADPAAGRGLLPENSRTCGGVHTEKVPLFNASREWCYLGHSNAPSRM